MATVATAVTMKMTVAAIERVESRAKPQTPWPDVQPLPMRVPKPTSKPPTATSTRLDVIAGRGSGAPASAARSGAAINPATNAIRQPRSEGLACSNPPVMPLTPAMRPVKAMRAAAATPIRAPPSSPESAVRLCILGLLQCLVAFLHLLRIEIDVAAHLLELGAHLRHALFSIVQRRGVVAHVLGDLHRAEFRAAHRAEMRDLVRFLRQRLVVEAARGLGVEA